MDAIERAQELMETRGNQIPKLALEYRSCLFKESGACMEVALTAFAYYAQQIEGLTCSDPSSQLPDHRKVWFLEQIEV